MIGTFLAFPKSGSGCSTDRLVAVRIAASPILSPSQTFAGPAWPPSQGFLKTSQNLPSTFQGLRLPDPGQAPSQDLPTRLLEPQGLCCFLVPQPCSTAFRFPTCRLPAPPDFSEFFTAFQNLRSGLDTRQMAKLLLEPHSASIQIHFGAWWTSVEAQPWNSWDE